MPKIRPLRLAFRCPPLDSNKGQHNAKKNRRSMPKIRPLRLAIRCPPPDGVI
ncbi:hypothetical protein AHAS_Ahas08G0048400 [Arachis hypogaea]